MLGGGQARLTLGAALACAAFAAPQSIAQTGIGFSAERPAFHRRLPDPMAFPGLTPQPGTEFGYAMVMGKVGSAATDQLDDLISASVFHNYVDPGSGSLYIDMGRAYPFIDEFLTQHPFYSALIALPPPRPNLQLGLYFPAIGRVDTTFADNMVFLGTGFRDVTYPAGGSCSATTVTGIGAVEILRLTKALPNQPNEVRLVPPRDASDSCAPTSLLRFGLANAVGQIDGMDGDELAVGSVLSDGNRGRVHVFFGGNNFVANAANLSTNPQAVPWVGIKSPAPAGETETFGSYVLIRDLDKDGKGELIVGAIEKNSGAGMVYVYAGTKIAALAKYTSHDAISAPPDQIIAAPAGFAGFGDWFGWTIFDVGNMVGVPGPAGRADIAIHAEGTDWVDPSDPQHVVPNAGALFVYGTYDAGETPTVAAPFLKAEPLVLFAPIVTYNGVLVHQPEENGRFGRGVAFVQWRRSTSSGFEEISGIVVGDPDAPVRDPNDPAYPHSPQLERAGRVFFLKAPLDAPGGTTNAWGDFVLLEPSDALAEGAGIPGPTAFPLGDAHVRPHRFARFGASIVSGRYTGFFPGSQFIVSARNRSLGSGAEDVGQAYSFHLPDLGP